MNDLVPQSARKDHDRCVRVRAVNGPYRGYWFRFYRKPGPGGAFAGDFDSELALDRHGTLVVYDLIETPDQKKWILTERRNND